jgi:hypothetical protein
LLEPVFRFLGHGTFEHHGKDTAYERLS